MQIVSKISTFFLTFIQEPSTDGVPFVLSRLLLFSSNLTFASKYYNGLFDDVFSVDQDFLSMGPCLVSLSIPGRAEKSHGLSKQLAQGHEFGNSTSPTYVILPAHVRVKWCSPIITWTWGWCYFITTPLSIPNKSPGWGCAGALCFLLCFLSACLCMGHRLTLRTEGSNLSPFPFPTHSLQTWPMYVMFTVPSRC